MKKTRFSEQQIIPVLKEAEAGVPVSELCRKHGIFINTLALYSFDAWTMLFADHSKSREINLHVSMGIGVMLFDIQITFVYILIIFLL